MEKQRWEESKKIRETYKSEKRKKQKKQDPGAQKNRRSRNTVFFQCFVVPGNSKSRLGKAAGAEPSDRWQVKNRTLP